MIAKTEQNPAPWRWQGDNLELLVYVQPGAKATGFSGMHDGRLKIRLNAPPVDGKANQHLIAFLGKTFKLPKSAIRLKRGESSRTKTLVLEKPQFLPAELLSLQG